MDTNKLTQYKTKMKIYTEYITQNFQTILVNLLRKD